MITAIISSISLPTDLGYSDMKIMITQILLLTDIRCVRAIKDQVEASK